MAGEIMVVSGTGTSVGKTVVSAAIGACFRRRGAKVVVAKVAQTGLAEGEPGDAEDAARLAGEGVGGVELVRYGPPLAPATAARLEGRTTVTAEQAAERIRELAGRFDLVVAEGAGGLAVRLAEDRSTVADVASATGAPVVVVVEAGLGTLSHTALVLEALARRGLRCGGVVIGRWPAQPDLAARTNFEDLGTLAAEVGSRLAGVLPDGAGCLAPAHFSELAPRWLARELGGVWDASSPPPPLR